MRDPFHLRSFAGLVAALGGLAGLRALWFYGRSRLGAMLLALSVAGVLAAGVAWLATGWPRWRIVAGGVGAVGPLWLWVIVRWLSYEGRPPGLVCGPEPLEAAETAVEQALEVELKSSAFGRPREPDA